MNRSGLRGRVARLEGAALATVTFEELLDRLGRDEPYDDPEFHRRLAASPIGRVLDDLIARFPDDKQEH